MELDTTTLRPHVNTRLTVRLVDGSSVSGALGGARADALFIDGQRYAADAISDVTPDPLICAVCGRDALNLFDGALCAACYRDAARGQKHTTVCDNCGAPDAFRNPGHRRNEYLCGRCHRAAGESIPLVPSVSGLIADCRTYDQLDPRHDMHHVRGNQFGCRRCGIKVHNPELRKRMVAEALER